MPYLDLSKYSERMAHLPLDYTYYPDPSALACQDRTLPQAPPTPLPAQSSSLPRPHPNVSLIDPSLTQLRPQPMFSHQLQLPPGLPATYNTPALTPPIQPPLSNPTSYAAPVLPHPVHPPATHQGRITRGRGNNGKKFSTEHIVLEKLMAKVKTYPKKCAQCNKAVYGAIQHFEHQRVHGLRKNEVPDDGITMSTAEISTLQDYYYDFYGQGPWKCPECDKVTDHFRNFIFHLESATDPKSRVYRSHQSNNAKRSKPFVSSTASLGVTRPAGSTHNGYISTASISQISPSSIPGCSSSLAAPIAQIAPASVTGNDISLAKSLPVPPVSDIGNGNTFATPVPLTSPPNIRSSENTFTALIGQVTADMVTGNINSVTTPTHQRTHASKPALVPYESPSWSTRGN